MAVKGKVFNCYPGKLTGKWEAYNQMEAILDDIFFEIFPKYANTIEIEVNPIFIYSLQIQDNN